MGVYAEDIQLTTVIVPDNNMQTLPCAFFLTTDCRADTLAQCLAAVAKRTGPLTPNVFMSNDAMNFFKGKELRQIRDPKTNQLRKVPQPYNRLVLMRYVLVFT